MVLDAVQHLVCCLLFGIEKEGQYWRELLAKEHA